MFRGGPGKIETKGKGCSIYLNDHSGNTEFEVRVGGGGKGG